MKKARILLLALLTLLAFAGCSGSDDEDDGNSLFRVINAAPDAERIDVILDDDLYIEGQPYLADAGYDRVSSDFRDLAVTISNSFTTLVAGSISFENNTDYTLIVMGRIGNASGVVLTDINSAPNDDRARLRVVNVASVRGSIDVYITGANDPLGLPSIEDLSPEDSSFYMESVAGDYRIRITPTNSLEVVADSGPITLEEGMIRTALFVDSFGGGPPYQIRLYRDRK